MHLTLSFVIKNSPVPKMVYTYYAKYILPTKRVHVYSKFLMKVLHASYSVIISVELEHDFFSTESSFVQK